MTSSSTPKLPLWVFVLAYLALLATAAVFIVRHERPYSEATTLAIMSCVIGGTVVLLVPVIARYERQKNETLDDRQNALEALARTVGNSAEQISIAANGFHEIADLVQKNLKQAEQLPHKLHEKIAEFQAQLANANDVEKEELEKELEELRASETERLQSVSDRIARTAAEFAKLETSTQQHLTAATEALSKLSFGTAGAIGKAQAAAEQALSHSRQEAARAIDDSIRGAVQAVEAAKVAALRDLTTHIDAQVARLKEAITEVAASVPTPPATGEFAARRPRRTGLLAAAGVPGMFGLKERSVDAPAASNVAPARSVPPESTPASSAEPLRDATTDSGDDPTDSPAQAEATRSDESAPKQEPAAPTSEVASAPVEAEVAAHPAPAEAAPADPVPSTPADTSSPALEDVAPKPARKRSRRDDDNQPGLGLELDDPTPGAAGSRVVDQVLSSDGATRLVVTAYIGIGNRLFVRGSGPGLSWDKGVPLQFVSIGKWRWETNEADAPVQLRLLKNDEQECTGLGAITIAPGQQQEVTANF